MPGRLSSVDPVAIVRRALVADEGMQAALGGADAIHDRVGGENEPPYPRIVLTDPPGDDRDLQHLVAPVVQIEVLGDLDGSPGKPALRALLYDAIEVIAAIPHRLADPGQPIITAVRSSGGGGWSPLPNGQPRYLTTLRLYGHPAPPTTPAATAP